MMVPWKQLRIILLAILFVGVLLVLGKSMLFPTTAKDLATPFEFPVSVTLGDWEPIESAPLPAMQEDLNFMAGQKYRYKKKQLSLDIEMRYLIHTNGDVEAFLNKYVTNPPSAGKLALRQKEAVGFYGLGETSERKYLSACINPQGGTTITHEQFRQNRNTYDIGWTRVLSWLMGRSDLRDQRCLWALLSLPLKATQTPQETDQLLETAWFSWYQWWKPRFPSP